MSALLSKSTTSHLCRCHSYTPSQSDQLVSLFHSSSFISKQFLKQRGGSTKGKDSTPSRKRLARDLTPTSKKAEFRTAPKFERDDVPHTSIARRENDRNASKPHATWKSDRDRMSQTGRWGDASREESYPQATRTSQPEAREVPNTDAILDEFYNPPSLVSSLNSSSDKGKSTRAHYLPTEFSSPPLLPGLLLSLQNFLPPGAKPTPIQALSIKWVLQTVERDLIEKGNNKDKRDWKQWLLASETGSGKSIAYLLPMLQNLKTSEMMSFEISPLPTPAEGEKPKTELPLNPRALVLAPTHELTRQLSVFAKGLLHDVKLRVLCTSRENTKTRGSYEEMTSERSEKMSSRDMKKLFRSDEAVEGVFSKKDGQVHPVDLVVGTPSKLLEMVRGVGWNRVQFDPSTHGKDEKDSTLRRGRDMIPVHGLIRKGKPEMGLEEVEWVVIDEADILFDSDFKESTLNLLSDIAAARGAPLPPALSPGSTVSTPSSSASPTPIYYPFNLLLTSATIPSSLISHLNTYHPSLTRLTSPNIHKLPKTLKTEYVDWTGGNKFADIERRIRQVWMEDATVQRAEGVPKEMIKLSKVLIFANKSTKVIELGNFLEEKGVKCVKMTSGEGGERMRGSNKPLKTFLRPLASTPTNVSAGLPSDPAKEPLVLLTTSLLSRGLDFAPDIKHVFIIDSPRNMIDFLHRAGRSGRAGNVGKVVIFGKGKGRGSERARDVKKRVQETR